LEEKVCDKAEVNGNIFNHNVEWSTNRKRCPMYLSEINEPDTSWPVNEDECLQKFHNLKTMILIKHAIEDLGNNFALVEAKFSFMKKNNLKYDDLMKINDEMYKLDK